MRFRLAGAFSVPSWPHNLRVALLGFFVAGMLVAIVGAESDWANGFRAGWSDGWNDALDAMRAASIDAGASEDSLELQTLNAALKRQARQ